MAHRLRVASVASASRLRAALAPGEAEAHGELDDGVLVVADRSTAEALVDRHHNVSWADAPPDTPRPSETPRAELDGDKDVTYRCGVNDCSREVDGPADTCWQHEGSD